MKFALALALILLLACLFFAYLAGIASNNRHYPAAIIFASVSVTLGIAAATTIQRLLH